MTNLLKNLLGALLAMLTDGQTNPIDTISELADNTNVNILCMKESIIIKQLKQFQNRDVRKIASQVQCLDKFDYHVGFAKLANLERYAWIESKHFMSCGSAEHGELLLYMPKSNPYSTFYEDFIAFPFPKNSTLIGPFNKV